MASKSPTYAKAAASMCLWRIVLWRLPARGGTGTSPAMWNPDPEWSLDSSQFPQHYREKLAARAKKVMFKTLLRTHCLSVFLREPFGCCPLYSFHSHKKTPQSKNRSTCPPPPSLPPTPQPHPPNHPPPPPTRRTGFARLHAAVEPMQQRQARPRGALQLHHVLLPHRLLAAGASHQPHHPAAGKPGFPVSPIPAVQMERKKSRGELNLTQAIPTNVRRKPGRIFVQILNSNPSLQLYH